ncbi:MAG: hypothetical protein WCP68_13475, partial [Enhydrobacter sp.]
MSKFEMDTEFIRKLAKLLEETNLGEIEMADGDRKIRVARPAVAAAAAAAPGCRLPGTPPPAALAALPARPELAAAAAAEAEAETVNASSSGCRYSISRYMMSCSASLG